MSQTASSSSINNPENETQSDQPEDTNTGVPVKYSVFPYHGQGAPNFTIILEERPEPGDLYTFGSVNGATEISVYDVVFMIPSGQGAARRGGASFPPLEYVTACNLRATFLALPSSFMRTVREQVKKAWIGMGRLEKIILYEPWTVNVGLNLRAPEGFEFWVVIGKEKLPDPPNHGTGTYVGALSFFVMKRLIDGVVHVDATGTQAGKAQGSDTSNRDAQESNAEGSGTSGTNTQASSA
ncbi:46893a70-6052-48d9-8943-c788799fee5a [Sclerotinia trifoliorum]|uniref:46893a70-6052-48d9-8943-c788799fee5a n=1 Tax=Sclerotinia trifoliorum TaxID=28548 RepID=A0A8H2VYV4_9HELO|nr:46893a70-6052-48d9-8943-c788799fee5a [Sclerotinia trifoliorum]